MIDVIVPPDPLPSGRPMIFLAGGITGCPDWQSEMIRLLDPLHPQWLVLNPRREQFPIDDPDAAFAQIAWEHRALRAARAIIFWFPRETVCPIALYELGAWSMTQRRIFVGAHEAYPRRLDIEIQTRLARPDVSTSAATVAALADEVLRHIQTQ
ncbi:MAG TPA: nucleoside 2-deoxyribosyltransferase domain-containing protein [Haliangiales bacterium]|nr:nucleoside 2-deoxyribosyltransferase domain-containing protein [Haliangiales bacterium]